MKAIPSLLIASAVLLSACGGEKGDTRKDNWVKDGQSLAYSYPYDAQQQVPTPAPIVLRFTSPVTASNPSNAITLHTGNGQNGVEVAYTLRTVDNGMGVVITPNESLSPLSAYTIAVHNLKLQKGTAHDAEIRFTTAPLHEGARSEIAATGPFKIVNQIPDGTRLPVMDFSSIRLQLSQPIDTDTLDGIALKAGANDVPAHILVNGPYITVDPKDDLTAGQSYTLSISGLKSTLGETLANTSITLAPKDSKPRATMVQQVSDSNQRSILSPLTGMPINLVPMESVLLGKDNATQQTGDVHAELAFVPKYPDVTPLRISRGSLLKGSAIDVKIGGKVPAGFNSGDVTITFLSDANGYLMPNPFNGAPEAPRQIRLFMDVALSAADSRANGAITQDMLHVELVGTSIVENGQMVINAVGVVEPNVLGAERAKGILSFYMRSYADQNNPPPQQADTTPPTIQSWIPGSHSDKHMPGDPVIINFSKAMDHTLPSSAINLKENGVDIPFSIRVDGSSIVIKPKSPLKRSKETQAFTYQISINDGIQDLAGNPLSPVIFPAFSLKTIVENREAFFSGQPSGSISPTESRAPIILSVYPGFPCALDSATRNLRDNLVGRCKGGFPGWNTGSALDIKAADDILPLQKLAANKPIIVSFSKEIMSSSIQLGGSFKIEEIDESDSHIAPVSGTLEILPTTVVFRPDQPWKIGSLYRYTLGSNNDRQSSSAVCDGTIAICDINGLPLQTDVFSSLEIVPNIIDPYVPSIKKFSFMTTAIPPDAGGPSMVQYFKGSSPTKNVLELLKGLPSSDTNANFIHEENYAISDGEQNEFHATLELLPDYHYQASESGATNQGTDPYADQIMDPDGVIPPPNSAKILSREQFGIAAGPAVNGVNIGCGYEGGAPYDANNPFSVYMTAALKCPKQKFTYLTSSISAEVTDEYVEGKGLKVLIWPAQIMSTALPIRAQLTDFPYIVSSNSGAQLLRMRYEKDNQGNRNQPITAWIKDINGEASLEANVDLYMDGLELSSGGRLPYNDPEHNLLSKPVTMKLSGKIKFLDDGRMLIEQYNLNNVDIDIQLSDINGINAGLIKIRIPSHGSRLNYISRQIK